MLKYYSAVLEAHQRFNDGFSGSTDVLLDLFEKLGFDGLSVPKKPVCFNCRFAKIEGGDFPGLRQQWYCKKNLAPEIEVRGVSTPPSMFGCTDFEEK